MKRLICTLLWILFVFGATAQIGVFKSVISDTTKVKDYRFQQLPNYSVYGALTNITAGDQNLSTPPGNTASRPTVPVGKYILRYNTDSSALEIGNPAQVWKTLAMSSVQNFDTSSISNFGLKIRSQFSGTSPILYNGVTGNIGIQQSSSSQAGYLSQADWIAFNAKLSDPGSNGFLVRTAPGITASRSFIAASNNISIVNPTGVPGNPSFDINDTLFLRQISLSSVPAMAPNADSVLVLNRTTGLFEVHPVAGGGGSGTFNKAGGGISASGDSLFLNQSFTRGLLSGVSPISYNSSTGAISLTTVPIALGGTNSSTSLLNNRIMQSTGGAIVEAPAITANRALISDANGIPTHTAVTATELGYLSGVTSAIQTQLNSKLNASDTTNKWINNIRRLPGSTNVEIFKNGSWVTAFIDSVGTGGGGGGVTQVNTGFGVTGGPITSTGTIKVDTTSANRIVTQAQLNDTADKKNFKLGWFAVRDFGATGDSLQDATPYIQAAINAAKAHKGGVVYFHNGFYRVGGAIIPTIGTRPCNCQLYIPNSPSDSAITIEFLGESNNFEFQAIGNVGTSSKGGVIIESSLSSATAGDALIAAVKGPGDDTFTKTNHTDPYFRNLTFRTRRDQGTAFPLSGVNIRYASKTNIDQVRIDVNVPIGAAPDPSGTGSIGIMLPEKSNHASVAVGTLRVGGYEVGMELGEHAVIKDFQVVSTSYGINVLNGDHSASIQTFEGELNKTNIVVNGDMNVEIANFNTEHYTGSLGAKWYNFVSDITFNSYTPYSTTPGTFTIGNTNVGISGVAGTLASLVTNDSSRIAKLDRTWINRGIVMTNNPSPTTETNIIKTTRASSTVGMIAGSANNFDCTVGPFIAMRGNEYTTNSASRGTLTIGAGYVPSSPTGSEGGIRIFTGATLQRAEFKRDGTFNVVNLMRGTGTDRTMIAANISGDLISSDTISHNVDAEKGFEVHNKNAGTSAAAYYALRNNVGFAAMELFGGNNSSAPAVLRTVTDAANGMALATLTNAPIKFLTNSNGITNLRATILGGGGFLIGRTALIGTELFSVNGTINANADSVNLATGGFVFRDAATGAWKIAPVGTSTTLYTGDGTVATNRTVSLGGTINFSGSVNSDTAVSISNNGTTATGLFVYGTTVGANIQSPGTAMTVFGTTAGMNITSSTNEAILAQSNGTRAGKFITSLATNNTVEEVLSLQRGANPGVGAAGIGAALTLTAENGSGGQVTTAQLVGKMTTVTAGAEVGQVAIVGLNGGSNTTYMELSGAGNLKLNNYTGGVTGTPSTALYTNSTGDVIQAAIIDGSATLDFSSTASGTSTDLTITVTGAAVGDLVYLGVPNGSITTAGSFMAWVSATNTVTVRFTNPNASSMDPASGTFKVRVIK